MGGGGAMIAEEPITQLYVWIAVYPDGSEGMLSRDMPTPWGKRHMPLFTSKLDVAQKMQRIAELIQTEAEAQGEKFDIVMRAFRQELG